MIYDIEYLKYKIESYFLKNYVINEDYIDYIVNYVIDEIDAQIKFKKNFDKDEFDVEETKTSYLTESNVRNILYKYYERCKTNNNIEKIFMFDDILYNTKKIYICKEIEEEFLGEILKKYTKERAPFFYNKKIDCFFEERNIEYKMYYDYKTYYVILNDEKTKIIKDKMVDKGSHYEVIL